MTGVKKRKSKKKVEQINLSACAGSISRSSLRAITVTKMCVHKTAPQYLQEPVSPIQSFSFSPLLFPARTIYIIRTSGFRWETPKQKTTQTQGHSAVMCPSSGTGCQTHPTKHRPSRLLGGSWHVCFQLLSHSPASASPSLRHHLQKQNKQKKPKKSHTPPPPFSIIFTKRNEYGTVYTELNRTV